MQNEKGFSSLEAPYESTGLPASAGDKCSGMREEQLYDSLVEASRPTDKRHSTMSGWQQGPGSASALSGLGLCLPSVFLCQSSND